MSHYVTPFLVLNLGSEMLYVISQRLQAQHVDVDRAVHVLDEITSTLISQELITDIMKPQHPYNHDQVRKIIEDVAESSVMRLDINSMNRLWDLVTMVFKWQVTLSSDVIKITIRHLYEIETFVAMPETQLQLQKVQNLIDNFTKILTVNEKIVLHQGIIDWLQFFNVRVSLFLRLGLQRQDASFLTESFPPGVEDMVKNLGENVYAVTQNKKQRDNYSPSPEAVRRHLLEDSNEGREVQMFVDQIKRNNSNSVAESVPLKLSIDDDVPQNIQSNGSSSPIDNAFIYSEIAVTRRTNGLEDIFSDITCEESGEENDNFPSVNDDLLDTIINTDDNN